MGGVCRSPSASQRRATTTASTSFCYWPERQLSQDNGDVHAVAPVKLLADKGYDFAFCRRYLRKRDMLSRITRRGIESKERVG